MSYRSRALKFSVGRSTERWRAGGPEPPHSCFRGQEGDLDQQIWTVAETISLLSTLVSLRPRDLIMTGTPKVVGRVEPGDHLVGHIEGVGDLSVSYET
jgi:2-keto-4-pentenoate hydratase/2-oxohepta-3-ene-1,7-dioic acid hydratase in catechol pathway